MAGTNDPVILGVADATRVSGSLQCVFQLITISVFTGSSWDHTGELTMTVLFQSHGGKEKPEGTPGLSLSPAARPAGADIAVDEQADFGYLIPPLDAPENYLPETGETLGELDELGNLMIDQAASETSVADLDAASCFDILGTVSGSRADRTDRSGKPDYQC
ncbi:hypothetical protein N8E89_21245 (plasmid) [Phyllobacterium sp. A18/5-2]|uniref:hypothetical protein n=1 Tax=Phyllobacterium sp. A18/5-2 TaxID=2978392 RepID=UPI0021CA4AD0|nr:hypothetical protein [Phyllobacterium sp. A18/5-2]UXN67058.1 hypothetical protein N8E89_21245 [Phyllobacterium sp. A18/5-2]